MAGVIGGPGGYATVGPTRNYIGEAMSNVQDNMYRQNAQRMANEKALQEQQQAVKEAQDKKDKEAIDYAEKHKLTKTGIKSVDSKNYEIALKLQQLNVEGVNELSQAKTIEEKTAAMAKIQKASIGFDTINKFNNDYAAVKEDLLKNGKNYDPNFLVDIADEGKKFDNGQYEYSLDDDYNVRFNTHDIDPATGKVSAVTGQNLSGDEMVSKFKGLPKSNYAGEGDGVSFLDNFSKRIKEKKEETKVNGKIITDYPTAVADAEAAAKAAVSDPSLRFNVKTQIAKALNISKSEVTDEQVYQKILADVKSLIPSKKEEIDNEAWNRSNKVSEQSYQKSQDKIANDFKTKEFNEKQLDKNTVTVGTTEYKFTDIGAKAKKDFYSKPENKGKNMTSEDWPAGSFKVIRTSTKVNSKTPATKPVVKETPKERALRLARK